MPDSIMSDTASVYYVIADGDDGPIMGICEKNFFDYNGYLNSGPVDPCDPDDISLLSTVPGSAYTPELFKVSYEFENCPYLLPEMESEYSFYYEDEPDATFADENVFNRIVKWFDERGVALIRDEHFETFWHSYD